MRVEQLLEILVQQEHPVRVLGSIGRVLEEERELHLGELFRARAVVAATARRFDVVKVANVRPTRTHAHGIPKSNVEYRGELHAHLRDVSQRRGIVFHRFHAERVRLGRRGTEIEG